MPRDLADVLHYFLPELEESASPGEPPAVGSRNPKRSPDAVSEGDDREGDPPPVPILGLPIGDRDVVRAALAWNLAIETTRLGRSTALLAPERDRGSPLWPEPGIGPLGCELLFCPAKDLTSLFDTAAELAHRRSRSTRRAGVVFVRVPPEWLADADAPANLVRWLLVLTSSRASDLDETLALSRRLVTRHPAIEIGITIHGVSTIAEARGAYESVARRTQQELDLVPISYGLLVDDLDVYRAIAAQRPIALAHPQSPAARALADVARLIYEDARSRILG